ncbi:hypothetical protein [Herbiconiux flava]|uniref:DUF11 domain-containing protein n=1 Tax=Herbiconiux flava TaxID=881268 RepID=A0A852SQX9_9MICO|nr:hypothetical protein [Herbiconiux flava]NYD71120.1 hypothetical protein [Herbiconiux flava]
MLLAVAGGLVAGAPPAQALGCVLGPSLASAARAVGISCPQIDGGSGAEHWGAAGGACNFGWESTNLPPGLLDFLSATMITRAHFTSDGDSVTATFFRKRGKLVGAITIISRPDKTFTMNVDVYGRDGIGWEGVGFDCKTSKDGPMYKMEPFLETKVLPDPGGTRSAVTSFVSVRGSMTAVGTATHLLRVDVTNNGTHDTIADVQLDLDGYRVTGVPTLPPGAFCTPAEGLVCMADGIAPGATASYVLLLQSDGDFAAGASIDAAVSSQGLVKSKTSIGAPPVRRAGLVTDFFVIDRP